MDRLTYPKKFLLISVVFGVPLALVTVVLFGEINRSLEIVRRQIVGLRCLEAVGEIRSLVTAARTTRAAPPERA